MGGIEHAPRGPARRAAVRAAWPAPARPASAPGSWRSRSRAPGRPAGARRRRRRTAPPRPAPAAPAGGRRRRPEQLAPVKITGSRPDDVQERRQSTAAKIIIGREEIDRFGDSTLGDVLKRLPGVTIQGRPGRGGAIRLRGLGSGYTQILLDGERVPPGFSLDSITPDQIERIEILRAPTAETGARAIAGTINIITRERLHQARQRRAPRPPPTRTARCSPSASWTRNISEGAWTINYSLSAYYFERDNGSTTTTVDTASTTARVTLAQRDDAAGAACSGAGVHANGAPAVARRGRRRHRDADADRRSTTTARFAAASVADPERRRARRRPTTRPRPTATYALVAAAPQRASGTTASPPGGRIEWRAGARPVARAGEQLSHRGHRRRGVAHARQRRRSQRHQRHRAASS